MKFEIKSGVFPTMITPFTKNNQLDLDGIDYLVDYYVRSGCVGIFAVCQSSEMFFLSDAEKALLMRRVAQASAGRLQLVASGHTADDRDTQIRQLAIMAENGADASVIVLNRLAGQDADESVVKRQLESILLALPDITFGIYECPYPYKRLASPDLMRWCAQTGRIVFIKDTCCRMSELLAKREAVQGTPLKIYNANTATLLDSLQAGIDGYSGIMANFHADLYVQLFQLQAARQMETARSLQNFLTLAALLEYQLYPVNAKYRRQMDHQAIELYSRAKDASLWNPTYQIEIRALYDMEQAWRLKLAR